MRCTKLPPHFPVTQELVGNLLDSGDTLEKAMAVNKSFLWIEILHMQEITVFENHGGK